MFLCGLGWRFSPEEGSASPGCRLSHMFCNSCSDIETQRKRVF
jgi:hypothetical protein